MTEDTEPTMTKSKGNKRPPYIGYTDYPLYAHEYGEIAPVRQVLLVSYDNDKYVQVRFIEDQEDRVLKAGYLHPDEACKRYFSRIEMFLLGGGDRKFFRPRKRRTTWARDQSVASFHEFDCIDDAKRWALSIAKAARRAITIVPHTEHSGNSGSSWGSDNREITVYPDGTFIKWKRRNCQGKYGRIK